MTITEPKTIQDKDPRPGDPLNQAFFKAFGPGRACLTTRTDAPHWFLPIVTHKLEAHLPQAVVAPASLLIFPAAASLDWGLYI